MDFFYSIMTVKFRLSEAAWNKKMNGKWKKPHYPEGIRAE